MTVAVYINNRKVCEEVTDRVDMKKDSQTLYRRYNIELLKKCGVSASVVIEGVPSAMNKR